MEDAAERRPRLESELDQVASVDGQVAEAVRAGAFLLHHLAKAQQRVDLVLRRRLAAAAALAQQVGVLVVDELEGELVAVPPEEAARPEGVAFRQAGTCGGDTMRTTRSRSLFG